MRPEAYFRMSAPGGVDASQSLLLGYNYQTHFLVPFVAARRKQWAVALSGIVAVLAVMVTTPLMSAVMSKETVNSVTEFEVMSNAFIPSPEQIGSISARLEYLLYGYRFLGYGLPSFTADEYAILPFSGCSFWRDMDDRNNNVLGRFELCARNYQ